MNHWLRSTAAVVTAALTILVIVGLIASRAGSAPRQAVLSPSPSAVVANDYGPPPAGVPLIYVTDPSHAGWYLGFDWSGIPRGTVKLAHPPATGVGMAPDGQGFAYGLYAKGGAWEFLDRLGKSTGSDNLPGAYSTMWADDNKHICAMTMDPNTLTYNLWTASPGEDPHNVSAVAQDANVGQTSVAVIGCSFRNDRAIALRTTTSWPAELWVVRLSDGNTLEHHVYDAGLLASVVANADATYIGETAAQATTPSIVSARYTTIRRVSDWAVVASMDPYVILAFGGDGSSVLTQFGANSPGEPSRVVVMRWTDTGAVSATWTYNGTDQLWDYTAEPVGDGFALGFLPASDVTTPGCPRGVMPCDHLQSVLIVHADGSSVQLPDRYNPTW